MAYSKTNWVNGYTPLNASNMNKIEEGIFNNDTFLSSLDVRVGDLEESIGQGGIGSVVVNGNGNALTNASYNPSTKILNFEKNNTFALDSDLDSVNDKNLYHLGAFDSVSGNVITRQTGYYTFKGNETYFKYADINRYAFEISEIKDNLNLGVINANYVFNRYASTDKTFGINNDSQYTFWIYDSDVDESQILTYLKGKTIQYKLATSYTEQVINDRPLNTLDQAGSQWLRSEWEKGLNLLQEDIVKQDTWNIKLGYANLKAGVTYNLWCDVAFPLGQWAILNDSNRNTLAFGGYGYNGNGYFTLANDYNGYLWLAGTFTDVNPTKAILNIGSHPYSYEPYHAKKHITNEQAELLKQEWEKGLNLWSNGNISANKTYSQYLPAGTYTYGFNLNASTPQGTVIKIGDTNIISESISTGYHSYTFITNGDTLTHLQYGGNSSQVMLNEGSHPYPYQEYRGEIVREDQLIQRKIFEASNSTMSDVLDFVRNNYDHIISIIYYAHSEAEAFGRSVIYNADEGILAYIQSGFTFTNVELNTSEEEGSDYIYIYYNKY